MLMKLCDCRSQRTKLLKSGKYCLMVINSCVKEKELEHKYSAFLKFKIGCYIQHKIVQQ
jgi:hypothetical protein